eukprot:2151501-Alexandrium_andersonii.AAC.1
MARLHALRRACARLSGGSVRTRSKSLGPGFRGRAQSPLSTVHVKGLPQTLCTPSSFRMYFQVVQGPQL